MATMYRFKRDFDYSARTDRGLVSVAYKRGDEHFIPEEHAAAADAAGAGERFEKEPYKQQLGSKVEQKLAANADAPAEAEPKNAKRRSAK